MIELKPKHSLAIEQQALRASTCQKLPVKHY